MNKAILNVTMKKVKAVARRKSALVFLLLCIMVILLSPWADAPSPSSTVIPLADDESLAIVEPVTSKEISRLAVEVALPEREYQLLTEQNDQFMLSHPDIIVELRRIDPEQAYSTFKRSSEMGESADIMLLSNDWVKEFASSGYLLPTDAAFVGKALAEQFDAIVAPLKWNGYTWGVPREMDPFVMVWNKGKLHEWLGEDVTLPLTIEQWFTLANMSSEHAEAMSWLSIDRKDPLALLAWLENATDERSDGLWEKEDEPWTGSLHEQALMLLQQHRATLNVTTSSSDTILALKQGTTIAGLLPYSEASAVVEEPRLGSDPNLELDHLTWRLPYVSPRANCFAISSSTDAEEAAYVWISEMTDDQSQLRQLDELNKLPVYRSLYDSDRKLSNLLPGRTGQTFPNQAPLHTGPDQVARLARLSNLWSRLAAGQVTVAEWREEWQTH
ncbi:extracellular solute-binding protein [Cohnella luojiensis]|uniref:Extracellular solute-binding protein n=1 Tax=Cohnella luojiensis TaxID=652876 RepID=A0A4Y8MB96_9BACL|nr:extracellular solute-binding protein [Cohnella luojiensis]TFE31717.1 extracellular solute-binding protein [Cohnella luojiensis]